MPTAHILENDNVSVLNIVFKIGLEVAVKSLSVWRAGVRTAMHQYGMLFTVVFRLVDCCVKFHSVTHRDHDLPFRVDFFQSEFGTVRLSFGVVLRPPFGGGNA